MAATITMPQTKGILDGPELHAVEAAVAASCRLKLLPDHQVTASQRQLALAGLTASAVVGLLVEEKDALIRFSIAVQRACQGDNPDGEFLPGEELPPEEAAETVEVLGLGSGFGLTHLCYYVLSVAEKKSELQSFLKATRIPGAAKFASQLRQIRKEVRS
ncbi:MAG: hypothetical protein RBU25_03915 [Lentisphaeria bacterium]|nr:hypothetical protein [Lentisphaeria bacterium]